MVRASVMSISLFKALGPHLERVGVGMDEAGTLPSHFPLDAVTKSRPSPGNDTRYLGASTATLIDVEGLHPPPFSKGRSPPSFLHFRLPGWP